MKGGGRFYYAAIGSDVFEAACAESRTLYPPSALSFRVLRNLEALQSTPSYCSRRLCFEISWHRAEVSDGHQIVLVILTSCLFTHKPIGRRPQMLLLLIRHAESEHNVAGLL